MHHWLQQLPSSYEYLPDLFPLRHRCRVCEPGQSRASIPSGECLPAQPKERTESATDRDQGYRRASRISGDNPLTDSEQADLAERIKQNAASTTPDGSNTDWAIEDTEVFAWTALQDKGYFKLQLSDAAYLIRAADDGLHFGLTITIESGPRYRLGNVSFVNTNERKPLAFSDSLLRERLDLQYGGLFNASKIRAAMEKMTRKYLSGDYLDMVPEPKM
jgi:outer membrane translocation and assembly module TamA